MLRHKFQDRLLFSVRASKPLLNHSYTIISDCFFPGVSDSEKAELFSIQFIKHLVALNALPELFVVGISFINGLGTKDNLSRHFIEVRGICSDIFVIQGGFTHGDFYNRARIFRGEGLVDIIVVRFQGFRCHTFKAEGQAGHINTGPSGAYIADIDCITGSGSMEGIWPGAAQAEKSCLKIRPGGRLSRERDPWTISRMYNSREVQA